MSTKTACDYQVHRQVRTYHLMWNNDHVGKITTVYPTRGFVQCVGTIAVWNEKAGHPLYDFNHTRATATAGGYGYCRESAAMFHAITKLPKGMMLFGGKDLAGAGVSAVESALRDLGYEIIV